MVVVVVGRGMVVMVGISGGGVGGVGGERDGGDGGYWWCWVVVVVMGGGGSGGSGSRHVVHELVQKRGQMSTGVMFAARCTPYARFFHSQFRSGAGGFILFKHNKVGWCNYHSNPK